MFLIHQEGEKNRERKTKTGWTKIILWDIFLSLMTLGLLYGSVFLTGLFKENLIVPPVTVVAYFIYHTEYAVMLIMAAVFSRALSVSANRNRTAKVAETKCGDFLLLHAAACVIAFRFTAYSSIYQVKVGSQLVIFAVGIFLGSFFLALYFLHAKQK